MADLSVNQTFPRAALLALMLGVWGCQPGPLERHRAIADETLRRTGAPDFADASTAERAAIVHTPSGLVCVLPRDGVFDFGVFPAQAANPGAHCSTAAGEVASTFVIVRFPPPMTLDAAFASTLDATAGSVQARPWDGQPSAADKSSPQGLPHFRIRRFEAEIGGAGRYLRVAMAEADGWFIQQVVSAPLEQGALVEEQAGVEWREALAEFARARAAAGR